jgi:flagellar hook assembly protein FlgD
MIPPTPALRLAQNFPNPAVGPTRIPFALPRPEHVTLRVFDAAGRVVATLVDRTLSAGPHFVEWDGEIRAGRRAPGGVYFYRLQSESGSLSKRMILLK